MEIVPIDSVVLLFLFWLNSFMYVLRSRGVRLIPFFHSGPCSRDLSEMHFTSDLTVLSLHRTVLATSFQLCFFLVQFGHNVIQFPLDAIRAGETLRRLSEEFQDI